MRKVPDFVCLSGPKVFKAPFDKKNRRKAFVSTWDDLESDEEEDPEIETLRRPHKRPQVEGPPRDPRFRATSSLQ